MTVSFLTRKKHIIITVLCRQFTTGSNHCGEFNVDNIGYSPFKHADNLWTFAYNKTHVQ